MRAGTGGELYLRAYGDGDGRLSDAPCRLIPIHSPGLWVYAGYRRVLIGRGRGLVGWGRDRDRVEYRAISKAQRFFHSRL